MICLGIETSCDETAAALVTEDGEIRSNVVSSQAELHARYGGVVPEVASRRHLELVSPVVQEALAEADAGLDDVESVAVTQGPGLIGALLVGLSAAKALAWARGLPLVPVDHLHGHVASLYLEPDPVEPPFLCLLASGGHTLLLEVRDHAGYRVLGTSIDDAAGEAFDKGARLLGLGYPGGAAIDRLAQDGDPEAFSFPVARLDGPRLLLLRPEDRAALQGAGPRRRGRVAQGGPRRVVPAGDRAGARRADGSSRGAGGSGDDRRRRRGRRQLRAARGAARRPLRAARSVHRQRRDDRVRGQVRQEPSLSSLP